MSTPKTNQIRILTCKALPGTEQRTNQKLSFFRANAVEESYLQSKMIQSMHCIQALRCASTPAHVVRVVHLPNPSPVLPPPAIPTEISWFCCHQQARSGKQQKPNWASNRVQCHDHRGTCTWISDPESWWSRKIDEHSEYPTVPECSIKHHKTLRVTKISSFSLMPMSRQPVSAHHYWCTEAWRLQYQHMAVRTTLVMWLEP